MIKIIILSEQKNVQQKISSEQIERLISSAFASTQYLKKVIQLHQLKQLFFQESQYDPYAAPKDPKNTARGIAQINKACAEFIGWTNWKTEWSNPEKSINYGTAWLDRLAQDFIAHDGPLISTRTRIPSICILHLQYQYPAHRRTILKSILSGDDDEWKRLIDLEKKIFFPNQSI